MKNLHIQSTLQPREVFEMKPSTIQGLVVDDRRIKRRPNWLTWALWIGAAWMIGWLILSIIARHAL